MKSETPCKICGQTLYSTSYGPCEEKVPMDKEGVCFDCAFWLARIERGCPTIIDGCTYSPGNKTDANSRADHRGMSGRRFDIEYFDGRKITTYDLWYDDSIPERFRDRLSDTAKFIGGAVQQGNCWNSSSLTNKPFPLPNGSVAHIPKEN